MLDTSQRKVVTGRRITTSRFTTMMTTMAYSSRSRYTPSLPYAGDGRQTHIVIRGSGVNTARHPSPFVHRLLHRSLVPTTCRSMYKFRSLTCLEGRSAAKRQRQSALLSYLQTTGGRLMKTQHIRSAMDPTVRINLGYTVDRCSQL
jgi:hypothetical protein